MPVTTALRFVPLRNKQRWACPTVVRIYPTNLSILFNKITVLNKIGSFLFNSPVRNDNYRTKSGRQRSLPHGCFRRRIPLRASPGSASPLATVRNGKGAKAGPEDAGTARARCFGTKEVADIRRPQPPPGLTETPVPADANRRPSRKEIHIRA